MTGAEKPGATSCSSKGSSPAVTKESESPLTWDAWVQKWQTLSSKIKAELDPESLRDQSREMVRPEVETGCALDKIATSEGV